MKSTRNLLEEAKSLTELWSPRVVGEVNDQFIKVARVRGELAWHKHDHEDELFLILQGNLRIEYEDKIVELREGDVHVVPRGVLHNPVCDQECLIALIESKSTKHTGDTNTEKTVPLARQLRGYVQGSAAELFEIYDEMGNQTGTEYRSVVHREGYWHRAANVFVFHPNGRLLIQRRQLTKDVCPDKWDVSAAEHLKPGETFEQGALRGLQEELGINGVTLQPLGGVTQTRLELPEIGIKDFEFQQSFKTTFSGEIKIDPVEVLETRMITLDELHEEMTNSPEQFTPWFRQRAEDLDLL